MANVFSSEATISAKVKLAKLKVWGDRDRDGTLDPLMLASALKSAASTITAALYRRYGAQVLTWDIDDDSVPDLLETVSDKLTIYEIASGNNVINESVKTWQQEALKTLSDVASYNILLPGIAEAGASEISTASFESVFDSSDNLQTDISATLDDPNED